MSTANTEGLAEACLPMVRNIAWKLAMQYPFCFPVEELISEGQVALVECLHRFDADRGTAFGAFARPRVKGAMLDYIRQQCRWQSHRHRLAESRDAPPWALQCSLDAAHFKASELRTFIAGLPRRQRWAIDGMLRGVPEDRLARKHNVAYRTILRWQREGLKLLQQAVAT